MYASAERADTNSLYFISTLCALYVLEYKIMLITVCTVAVPSQLKFKLPLPTQLKLLYVQLPTPLPTQLKLLNTFSFIAEVTNRLSPTQLKLINVSPLLN